MTEGAVTVTGVPHQRDQETREQEAEIAREKTRGRIAYILIGALVVIVLGTFLYVLWMSLRFADLTTDVLISVLQTIGTTLLAPLVGLIGAVIGFYYGGQTAVQGAQTATQASTQAAAQTTQALTQQASELANPSPADRTPPPPRPTGQT